MRVPWVIFIWAVAICLAGCARNESVRVDIREVEPSGKHLISEVRDDAPFIAELQREKAALRAIRNGSVKGSSIGKEQPPAASLEITRRISNALREWKEYQAESAATERLPEINTTKTGSSGSVPKQISLIETVDVQRKYAVAYTNARLRVDLLQSQVAAHPEDTMLAAKLDRAKAELKSVSDDREAEIRNKLQSSVVTNTEPANENHAPKPGTADTSRSFDETDRLIETRLQKLCSSAASRTSFIGADTVNFGHVGYKTLDDTCASIDRTVSHLRDIQQTGR